jgi:energy-coupling factor transporter ATP-binding protein EcfA2
LAVIELKNLTYHYPLSETPALQSIDLEVEEGEFLAIVGANGAGKSTLCYTISGFIPHFFKGELAGSVNVAGMDPTKANLGTCVQKVGLVFQNPFNQISGSKFTVYEEIAFGLENLGVDPQEMRERVDEIIRRTRIADLRDRSPYALSGGQQQRVALASILVMKPQILVLDEPTSQLDPIGSQEVFQVIKEMALQGMTIVMAEHKVEWLAEYADRVLALSAGQIIKLGTPQEVFSSSELPKHGVGISRYTQVARRALQENLWLEGRRMPVTLDESIEGFREIIP